MDRRTFQVVEVVALAAVLTALWVFPLVLFPNPGPNDAIELANLQFLLLLLGLLGVVVALAVRRQQATVMRVGLGIFLVGVAFDFVAGLLAFGNTSNDRFGPLLFLPFPIGFVGVVALVVGVAWSGTRRLELALGAAYGLVAAAFVGAWTMLRGARDWLLAPYGFDITALVLVIGAVIVVLSRQVRSGRTGG